MVTSRTEFTYTFKQNLSNKGRVSSVEDEYLMVLGDAKTY